MATAEDALTLAASQLGIAERPDGSNVTPFSAWYGITGPWCAMFVSWVFDRIGAPMPGGAKGFAYCPTGVSAFRAAGKWGAGVAGIRRGDVVFFELGTAAGIDHVGIVENVEPDGRITSIDGNVGNRVGRITRRPTEIVGFGRPDYTGTSAGIDLGAIAGGVVGALGDPVGTLTGGVGAAVSAAIDATFGPLAAALRAALDPDNWKRVALGAAGLLMVLGGGLVIRGDVLVAQVPQIIGAAR